MPGTMIMRLSISINMLLLILLAAPARAQERPYFVTYDHFLEEPGHLEIGLAATSGFPRTGVPAYTAPWLEIEYGVNGWWTTELYLEGVTAGGDGSGFAGWRLEHRFRPLRSAHRVNPVLYVEYERVSEASRIQKEVVGAEALAFEPIADLRRERSHELEAKLILSSVIGSWNIAENFIAEKNLSEDESLEYGYSIGVSRPLALLATGASCRWCAETLTAGLEVYGGLGTHEEPTVRGARHFVAPVLGWQLTPDSTLKVSAGFGLTQASDRVLLRVGWTREFSPKGRP